MRKRSTPNLLTPSSTLIYKSFITATAAQFVRERSTCCFIKFLNSENWVLNKSRNIPLHFWSALSFLIWLFQIQKFLEIHNVPQFSTCSSLVNYDPMKIKLEVSKHNVLSSIATRLSHTSRINYHFLQLLF